MSALNSLCKIVACVILSSTAATVCHADIMMVWRDGWLQQVKSEMDSGQSTALPAINAVTAKADLALSRGPFGVTDKTGFPEDRDIHDYYSQGPYWWPDPEKADGLPYIRRDGEVNPEKYSDALDSNRRHAMVEDVVALTLAGFFTGDSRYLDHAALEIRTWFTDPRTAMNPNMQYAQSIPGRSAGRSTGIIDSRSFVRIVESASLLYQLDALNKTDMASLKAWFGQLALWLKTHENGIKEGLAENNHGTFYDLQLAVFSWFSGDRQTAREVTARFCDIRVERQVDTDGRMPHELARTRPFHYSVFNLQAMVNMALFAERMGEKMLPDNCTADHRMQGAVKYLADLGSSDRDWPDRPTDPAYEPVFELLWSMHLLTGDTRYHNMAMDTGRTFEQAVIHLLLPTQIMR